MSRIEKMFPGRTRAFIVAVHVGPDASMAKQESAMARDEGADGVILVNDYEIGATNGMVAEAYSNVRIRYPNWFVGINFTDLGAREALVKIPQYASCLWIDASHIDEDARDPCKFLNSVRDLQESTKPETCLFNSVAFKYQTTVKNAARAASLAEPYSDVVVTSGPETGVPADIAKIRLMRGAIHAPFFLASGISKKNAPRFIDADVDGFIVNSSVSDPKTKRLCPGLIRDLRAAIPTG